MTRADPAAAPAAGESEGDMRGTPGDCELAVKAESCSEDSGVSGTLSGTVVRAEVRGKGSCCEPGWGRAGCGSAIGWSGD